MQITENFSKQGRQDLPMLDNLNVAPLRGGAYNCIPYKQESTKQISQVRNKLNHAPDTFHIQTRCFINITNRNVLHGTALDSIVWILVQIKIRNVLHGNCTRFNCVKLGATYFLLKELIKFCNRENMEGKYRWTHW